MADTVLDFQVESVPKFVDFAADLSQLGGAEILTQDEDADPAGAPQSRPPAITLARASAASVPEVPIMGNELNKAVNKDTNEQPSDVTTAAPRMGSGQDEARRETTPKASSGHSSADDDDDCAICYRPMVLPLKLNGCGHSFCFLCIKSVAFNGEMEVRCPMCRGEIDLKQFSAPQMTRKLDMPDPEDAGKATEADQIFWLYEGARDSWWRFDPRKEKELEAASKSEARKLDIIINGHTYTIDFDFMTQKRADRPQQERMIRREEGFDSLLELTVQGISGVRLTDA